MRKIILVGAAVVVIGGITAGVAVTKAGAHTDTEALLVALNDSPPVAMPAGSQDQGDADAMVLAQAGPPPAPGVGAPPPPPPPGMPGRPAPGWGPGWMHGGPAAHRPMWHRAMFGLFYHKDDKQLTAADVQKIAEAFLLWQGNRDWKVTQVAADADGKIGFAFATSDGGVIARFTMDSKTGRIARIG
jgi:hypothetical protein